MKKGRILLLLLIPLLVSGGAVDQAADRFREANSYYEGREYDKALETYLLVENDIRHWKLFFNIGNCYFKKNQPVLAKAYFLKARRLRPFHRGLRSNIRIVNRVLGLESNIRSGNFISTVILRFTTLIPINVTSYLVVLFLFLLVGFLIYRLRIRGKRKWLRYVLSLCAVGLIVLISYQMVQVSHYEREDVALVSTGQSDLLSGPGSDNTVLFRVSPGLEVRILERSGDWFQVTAPDNIAGWVHLDSIRIIKLLHE